MILKSGLSEELFVTLRNPPLDRGTTIRAIICSNTPLTNEAMTLFNQIIKKQRNNKDYYTNYSNKIQEDLIPEDFYNDIRNFEENFEKINNGDYDYFVDDHLIKNIKN